MTCLLVCFPFWFTRKKKPKKTVNESSPTSVNSKQIQKANEHAVNLPVINLSEFENSVETAENFFSWLIEPIDKDTFFR